jgi:hypothetical protein
LNPTCRSSDPETAGREARMLAFQMIGLGMLTLFFGAMVTTPRTAR